MLMALFVSKNVLADIYKVVKNGRVTYTNIRPMNDDYDLVRVSKNRPAAATLHYRRGSFSGDRVALSGKKKKFSDIVNEKARRCRVRVASIGRTSSASP